MGLENIFDCNPKVVYLLKGLRINFTRKKKYQMLFWDNRPRI